ncbi:MULTISPECIES: eCIS core domain-containing protein [unclassified Sphingopyxis]|uniref:eCIS core domain-containing protein n=1 Tax=unclassified Sphingopyxis TaxID=2614943 RepID=UPI000735E4CF|nr:MULTISPECIES: DUF4157 domain-containing protein [unclassified Sphingopyxis]KTE34621.1 hypothetical protein ATE62_15925 [Sphingopyxis sp. HIX]KTE80186.1 hypothetical protein ATE72_18125 [Sphingopyxis sp. HXXIV]
MTRARAARRIREMPAAAPVVRRRALPPREAAPLVASLAAVPAVQRKDGGDAGRETIAASDTQLTSGGTTLPAPTRGFFEARTGRDLGEVRVHSGDDAAAKSASIAARAFTYKNHIWLGAGETPVPGFTMAHELAHVMQQTAPGPLGAPRVMRQALGDVRIAEGLHEAKQSEEARRAAAKKAAEEAKTPEAGVNMAGRTLTDGDIAKAEAASGAKSPTRITPAINGATFVLHDTASLVSDKRIAEVAGFGRRSSGEGAGAYAPKTGSPTVAHDPMFGPRRPTASEFEKGEDIMKEADREAGYRAIWKATARDVRESALDGVMRAQGSSAKEAKKERAKAIKSLDASKGKVFSAAAWAMEDICDMLTPANAANISADTANPAALTSACAAMAGLTAARRGRIGTHTNMEIVQDAGSDCLTKATKKRPLVPLAPYSTDQYRGVMAVYLRAALQARVFPEITTHFQRDKTAGDHCDPRCFNLGVLYALIQNIMGHPVGSSYGIAPAYGTGAAHNVWWNDTVCGGGHP